MKHIPILLLAAGASKRMRGRDKLLEPVAGGIALLAERLASCAKTGQAIFVALPPRAQAGTRWKIAEASGAFCVEIADPKQGLSASLLTALRALPENVDGAMVLPADMPNISTADLNAVLSCFDPEQVVRGAVGSKAGHPVLFPKVWFSRLQHLQGDTGARDVLKNAETRLIPLPGNHALTDLDTPEDWAQWRAGKADLPI